MRRIVTPMLAVLLSALAPTVVTAQIGGNYDLHWNALAGGGGSFATGGDYRLGGTVAQRTTGSLAADDYTLAAGFWTPAAAPNVAVRDGDDLPHAFAARMAGANPFRESTSIRFDLPQARKVSVALYGIDGRLVRELAAGSFGAGRHAANWDGADRSGHAAPPGIYFARVTAGDARITLRLVRVR